MIDKSQQQQQLDRKGGRRREASGRITCQVVELLLLLFLKHFEQK